MQREAGTRDVAEALTGRKIAIPRMVAGGPRNKDIADKLSISEGTIKVHLHSIFKKLKMDNWVALLRYAQEKGLV